MRFTTLIDLSLLLGVIYLIFIVNSNPGELGGVDYCIQWDTEEFGTFDRNDMLIRCYNFESQTLSCKYFFIEDNKLLIVDASDETKQWQFECSRSVKLSEYNTS